MSKKSLFKVFSLACAVLLALGLGSAPLNAVAAPITGGRRADHRHRPA